MDKSDCMKTARFRPYRKGCGPTFTLRLYYLGGERIGYTLAQHDHSKTAILFEGSDFRPSPLHSIDGDESVASLMNFLTLRKGDTDAEYFDNYTPAQIEFTEQHAEALSMEHIDN